MKGWAIYRTENPLVASESIYVFLLQNSYDITKNRMLIKNSNDNVP